MDRSGYILTTESDQDDARRQKGLGLRRRREKVSPRRSHQAHPPHRQYKYWDVWRRAMLQIKVRLVLKKVTDEVLLFGSCYHVSTLNENIKENIDEVIDQVCMRTERFRFLSDIVTTYEVPRQLINPDGAFKKLWNLIICVILVYTAVVMPFRLAFSDPVYFDTGTSIELVVDILFILDIGINFFTPFYTKSGLLVTSFRSIAKRYAKGWFFIDASSSIPFSLIEYFYQNDTSYNYRYNTLLRLARIPRLYKLLRVARLAKMLKYLRDNRFVERIQDFLRINSRVYKLLKFLATVCLCVHIFGCLWVFSSKLDDFSPDTWVVRNGYIDSDSGTAYIAAIYWAFTTITTVGYGDISGQSSLEQVLSIMWMIAGVGFYSVTIGSLSSFFSAIDTRNSVLAAKLAAVHEFAKQTGISKDVKAEVKRCVRYTNSKVGTIWSNKHSLFSDMPKGLKYKLAQSMYNGLVESTWFFKNKDPSFVIALLPLLRPMHSKSDLYLYKEAMYADEVFLIVKGRVNFVLDKDIVYKSFLKGSHIGEIEILLDLKYRENTAQVFGSSEFLVIAKKDLVRAVHRFENEHRALLAIAWVRHQKNAQAKQEVLDFIKLKARYGEVGFMAGVQTETVGDCLEAPPMQPNDKHAIVASMVAKLQDQTNSLEARVKQLTEVIAAVVGSKHDLDKK